MPEGQKMERRRRILMFSVFLLISVFIWFINALSKDYTSVIEYPLVYTDFPEDKVFVGEMPENLDLRINSNGYAILRYKTFKKPVPISFNLSAFTYNRQGGDSSRAHILTRYLRDQVAGQLPSELQLLEIKPDTLEFQFATRVTRMVRVEPDFRFQVDNQFTIKDGIILEPDSVEVTGPDVIIDTLKSIFTERIELGELTRDYSDRVRLQRIGDLEYSRHRVNTLIELERFTEVQLSIPIEVLNLPDSIALQTFPSNVKFTCKVGLSKYDRVEGNLIRAVVDFDAIEEETEVLDVTLQNLPMYLLSYEFYPKSVEYLKSRR
jgi:hypothetical protein